MLSPDNVRYSVVPKFDPKKSEMIDLLLQGLNEYEIAARLQIAQTTVSLWKSDPGVITDLARRRADRTSETVEQISALNAKAKAAIETVVDTSKNDTARLRAAEMILKISGVMMDTVRNNTNVFILQSSISDKIGRVLEHMAAINKIVYTMTEEERTIVREKAKHVSLDKKDPIPVGSDIREVNPIPVESDIKGEIEAVRVNADIKRKNTFTDIEIIEENVSRET